MNYTVALEYFVPGMLAILLVDTLGAITSRKYQFRYEYLGIISTIIYVGMGFLVSRQAGLATAAAVNCALGFFDSTIGLYLAIRLKANTSVGPERFARSLHPNTALIMILFAFLLGVAGHGLTFL